MGVGLSGRLLYHRLMIRVGIGGWTYAPWRGRFFPEGLPQAQELSYASRALTSIEINGTFYRTQKPESFRKWADETPEGFVFSVKAPRYATNRAVLAEAEPSIARFVDSGLAELGPQLGPILWQMPATKRFDPDDLASFLALLPKTLGGSPLRHAIEARHATFASPDFVSLMRDAGVAIVYVETDKGAAPIADTTADFVYARLQRCRETEEDGYPPLELNAWADRARSLEAGESPPDLPRLTEPAANTGKRDVFLYMISGAKERAPAAAMALIKRLGDPAAEH